MYLYDTGKMFFISQSLQVKPELGAISSAKNILRLNGNLCVDRYVRR